MQLLDHIYAKICFALFLTRPLDASPFFSMKKRITVSFLLLCMRLSKECAPQI